MSESARDDEQALLTMTGERRIDEHGKSDEWGRGGVYDAAGKFDLDATTDLLADRFAPVRNCLPETVDGYSRQPTQRAHSALYYWEGETENSHGVTVTERFVRVFPVGPYLHRWTCGIEERAPKHATNPKNGWASWHHPDANNADDIGTAVATALAVMRGEVSPR
jgi:hypothetical protein